MAGQLIPVLPGCRRLNNRPLNPGSTTLNRYMVTRFASRIVAIKGKVRLGSGGGQPSGIYSKQPPWTKCSQAGLPALLLMRLVPLCFLCCHRS
jgi:hypothetical protein